MTADQRRKSIQRPDDKGIRTRAAAGQRAEPDVRLPERLEKGADALAQPAASTRVREDDEARVGVSDGDWPFDSDTIYVGVPWYDGGEDWPMERGVAIVVQYARNEADARHRIANRTNAKRVDIVKLERPAPPTLKGEDEWGAG